MRSPAAASPAPLSPPPIGIVSLEALSLGDLVDEYLVALEVGGRSPRTVEWYRAFLLEYVAFATRQRGRDPVVGDLSTTTARRWLLAVQAGRGRPLSPSSLAGRVRTLRAFGGWAFREVGLPAHPLAGLVTPRTPDVLVPSLREPEMRALLAAASGTRDAARDQAVISLFLDSGVRLSELLGLRVGDVDLAEGRCRVRGKGARERIVPIGGRCRRAVRTWMAARGRVDPAAPLFVGRGGVRLPKRTVQQLVRRLAAEAGIANRCSPHVLRHSFARAFLANGGDVFALQRILGHSPASLQVTRRYVRLLDDDLRAAHRRASPLDRL
jgi:site-specific recombinase XerC